METINPYLNFMGNTEEAFVFYKSVFGGEFITVQRYKDTPEKDRVPANEQELLMHIALPIGENILMGTDALKSMGHRVTPGSNMSLSIDVGSEDEAIRLFNALSARGKVSVPLEKMFWGAFFGMCTDEFGIQWMINYNDSQQE